MKIKMIPILIWIFSLISFIFLGYVNANGQTTINDKTFKKTQVGITVVEFWADWNKKNECLWLKDLENTKCFRINIQTSVAKDYDVKVLPTIIVFNNGKEIERFEGNIKFQLCEIETPLQIQKVIDKLLINKF